MYLPEKPQPIRYRKGREEEPPPGDDDIMMDDDISQLNHHHQNILVVVGESSGSDHEPSNNNNNNYNKPAQKKRAETWVPDETRSLISLRRQMDASFNTSKSNKHLWEQISAKMKEKGFDRSPNMCTDKWRNLLKEFKKAKHRFEKGGLAKMLCYKEIEEILRSRNKNVKYKGGGGAAAHKVVDSFMQFSEKGIEEPNISFAHVEANGRPTLNLETGLDHDGQPLAITPADAVTANGVPSWNWRETPENGGENQSYGGRVIVVNWGFSTRRIGIDGTADAIKEAIKSAFRLRTKRAFWLEDEDQIVRSLDRDMPPGNYTLHLDEGLTVKVCLYDEADNIIVNTEDKIFYTEDDYREYLTRRGWTCLREEFDGYRNIENMDDLRPGAMYRGVN